MDVGRAGPLEEGRPGAGTAPPLITNAKFVCHPVQDSVSGGWNLATGEVIETWDPLLKWELQDVARRFLPRGHRLANCHRVRREDSSIQVRFSEEHTKAFYSGLQTCGLGWLCPVCAPKIQAVRAAELQRAIDQAAELGVVDMVTLTVPHRKGQSLQEVDGVRRRAWRSMQNTRGYRDLAKELGLVGVVVSDEVTWGPETGWHPHAHVLRFRRPGPVSRRGKLTRPDLRLFELWRGAVERRGWETPKLGGFSVQDGSRAAEYVAKLGKPEEAFTWGLADEMTRSHTKRGRSGLRFTPFDFLRAGAEGREGPWGGLWREYAAAVKGRQQLRWSQGLRERLGVFDVGTDEEIAESIGEAWTWARDLGPEDWHVVRRYRVRGELLRVAELTGRAGVDLFLGELHRRARDEVTVGA